METDRFRLHISQRKNEARGKVRNQQSRQVVLVLARASGSRKLKEGSGQFELLLLEFEHAMWQAGKSLEESAEEALCNEWLLVRWKSAAGAGT